MEGRAERATRLFAASDCLRREIGSRLMSLRNRMMIEQAINSARERHGEAAWPTAWHAGQAMAMDQAIEVALEKDAEETATG